MAYLSSLADSTLLGALQCIGSIRIVTLTRIEPIGNTLYIGTNRFVYLGLKKAHRAPSHSHHHSSKKWFFLRDPVFWGWIFLILMRNFPNMEKDFPTMPTFQPSNVLPVAMCDTVCSCVSLWSFALRALHCLHMYLFQSLFVENEKRPLESWVRENKRTPSVLPTSCPNYKV